MTPVLELKGITKRFGANTANEDVSLRLGQGEIVSLLGENGAGKTTLMSILFGHYTADAGVVRVMGQELPPGRSRAAIRAGVGMVHQHFALAPNLTVLENVMAGTRSLWSLRDDRVGARHKLMGLSERFGLAVRPEAHVSDLSVGECQRVEILKALFQDARILILDEPTAVLTSQEADSLFATLRQMTRGGLSLIFISHKLHEVMSVSDRVVVLRRGRVVGERVTCETSRDELAELMVGAKVRRPERRPARPGPVLLEGRHLDVPASGGASLKDVSFSLRAGQTLGIIGVSGNGQRTLGQLVSGLVRPMSGTLMVKGFDMTSADVPRVIAAGIGRIPEDRNAEGCIGDMTIWENVALERIWSKQFSRRGVVRREAARDAAEQIIERYDVRGAHVDGRIRQLSGGNMQKLILGRVLESAPDIIVAAQPSRGLDEGAIAGVHRRLLEARDRGAAVLLISEDLDEVVALSDNIRAIVGGKLSPAIPAERANARLLGLMMAGDWTDAQQMEDKDAV